jgi:chromosome partitioning protein
MSKIIVFGNEKGGSGKTTTAFHVAIALLKSSYRILTIDTDIRQKSFTRYLENRKQTIENDKLSLESPEIMSIPDELINSIDENTSQLKNILDKKKQGFDFIIVDTPGHYNSLSKAMHEQADIIITPINDSFLDVDLLGQVNNQNLSDSKAGVYSNMVFECKKQRALRDKKEIEWYVIRNRMSGTTTMNMQNIEKAVNKLSSKYGFKVISGFGDRVIFKELFLDGLTLSDAKISPKVKMNLSLVAARNELRDIVKAIEPSL